MKNFRLACVATVLLCPVADAWAQACGDPPRNPQLMHVDVIDGKPTFADNLCPGKPGSRPGDMCNAAGARPEIRFILRGEAASSWSFLRMELSSNGSDYGSPNLPTGALQDFTFASPQDEAAGRPAARITGNTMFVTNDNCNRFEVHYKVVVRDPSGNEMEVDPIIRNGGIGN